MFSLSLSLFLLLPLSLKSIKKSLSEDFKNEIEIVSNTFYSKVVACTGVLSPNGVKKRLFPSPFRAELCKAPGGLRWNLGRLLSLYDFFQCFLDQMCCSIQYPQARLCTNKTDFFPSNLLYMVVRSAAPAALGRMLRPP